MEEDVAEEGAGVEAEQELGALEEPVADQAHEQAGEQRQGAQDLGAGEEQDLAVVRQAGVQIAGVLQEYY